MSDDLSLFECLFVLVCACLSRGMSDSSWSDSNFPPFQPRLSNLYTASIRASSDLAMKSPPTIQVAIAVR